MQGTLKYFGIKGRDNRRQEIMQLHLTSTEFLEYCEAVNLREIPTQFKISEVLKTKLAKELGKKGYRNIIFGTITF